MLKVLRPFLPFRAQKDRAVKMLEKEMEASAEVIEAVAEDSRAEAQGAVVVESSKVAVVAEVKAEVAAVEDRAEVAVEAVDRAGLRLLSSGFRIPQCRSSNLSS